MFCEPTFPVFLLSLQSRKRYKMKRFHWIHIIVAFFALQLASCTDPELQSPEQMPLTEEPTVETELEMAWDIETDVSTTWDFGWDEQDKAIWGEPTYTEPTKFQVRRYYKGNDTNAPHTDVEAFSILGSNFQGKFAFGYYDMLFWSEIESEDGSQVVVIKEDKDSVTATTTGTKGLARAAMKLLDVNKDIEEGGIIGLMNQPEIFYASYAQNIYISRNPNNYTYDAERNTYTKSIENNLRPMVYIYLIQIVLLNNDGRVKDVNGNAAISGMASGTNLNTGRTNSIPTVIYFNTRMKQNMSYEGMACDIIGGKLNSFGLCDANPSQTYHVLFDLEFDNNTTKTYAIEVTDQCRNLTQGGTITVTIDCGDIIKPDDPEPESKTGSLFIPTVEDYKDVDWEFGF